MGNIDDKMMISVDPTWNPIINTKGIDGVEYYVLDNATGFDFGDLIDYTAELHTSDPLYAEIMNNVRDFGSGEVLNELFNKYCDKFRRTSLDMLCNHINSYCQSRPWPCNLYGVMNPYDMED